MSLTQSVQRRVRRFNGGHLHWQELAYCTGLRYFQFGEAVLDTYFHVQRQGFWVDVGAFHPLTFSNTYLLYRRGWRGIDIEPNPVGISEFVRRRARDINLLNCAVSTDEGQVNFTCDGVYSGISGNTDLFAGRNPDSRQIVVQARTLRSIFSEHIPPGTEIDFLSIDCAGHDLEVVQSNDWEQYRPRVVLVEDHEQRPDVSIERHLHQWGYRHLCTLRLTNLFALDDGARQPLA